MTKSKKKTSELTRVALYIRVSTARQKNSGESLETQQECLQKYVADHDNMIIVDTYIDGGISGQKISRDEFSRLIDDVKNDKIDLIIFTRLDRWFRNLRHFLNTNATLESNKCAWTAVNQPFYDTTTPHGRAFVNQSMTFAQLEAENDGERIRDHNEGKVARGEVLSGSVSIGFKIENKRYLPNDDNHIIKEMYSHYEQNQKLNTTKKWLESTYGIVRSQPFIKRILMDERNKGCYRGNNTWCPATVSEDQWERVQRLITMNVKTGANKKDYIFSRLVKCSCCDCVMIGTTHVTGYSKTGKQYAYKVYRCARHYKSKSLCENKKIIYESYIEKYLLKNIFMLIERYKINFNVSEKPRISNQKKRKAIQSKIDRLKDLYINDLITMDEYRIDKAMYIQQLESIPDDILVERDLSHIQKFLECDLVNIYKDMTDANKRALWRSIIKEIRVDDERNIHVIFL